MAFFGVNEQNSKNGWIYKDRKEKLFFSNYKFNQ